MKELKLTRMTEDILLQRMVSFVTDIMVRQNENELIVSTSYGKVKIQIISNAPEFERLP